MDELNIQKKNTKRTNDDDDGEWCAASFELFQFSSDSFPIFSLVSTI